MCDTARSTLQPTINGQEMDVTCAHKFHPCSALLIIVPRQIKSIAPYSKGYSAMHVYNMWHQLFCSFIFRHSCSVQTTWAQLKVTSFHYCRAIIWHLLSANKGPCSCRPKSYAYIDATSTSRHCEWTLVDAFSSFQQSAVAVLHQSLPKMLQTVQGACKVRTEMQKQRSSPAADLPLHCASCSAQSADLATRQHHPCCKGISQQETSIPECLAS